MKRILQLVTLMSCVSYTAKAQDLAYKIPEKAFTVGSIKSNQLLQLTSVNELDSSFWGKKLLGELSKTTDKNYTSITELGINLSSDVYIYYQITDSISYSGVLVPLADARKIEALFSKNADKIKRTGGINILERPEQKTVLAWNEQFLYLTYGNLNAYFFSDSAHVAQYGDLFNNDYTDYAVVDSAVAIPYPDSIVVESPEIIIDTLPTEPAIEPDTAVEEVPPPPPLSEEEVQASENKRRAKDSLLISWLTTSTTTLFNKPNTAPSILNNPDYQHSADKNAIATFWMADIQSLYTSFLPYYFMKYGRMMNGYGSFNARLYMTKENIRITGEVGLDKQKADVYKQVADHKLNKKFLQYIKSDSLIGFMSYAFNTEAYLNEIPKLLTGAYGRYEEEMALTGDLVSLMLDEKAIAKVIKGDALFLMTNVSEKQVSYKSYDYNEETFEYKDTVLTKTETLPDFLCMFSSDDTQLIEKLLQYGIKKEKITFNNGIYTIGQIGKNPFTLHILIKDGIVFFSTSQQDISQIHDGSFKGNLDKQQKELLMKNNMALFFSPKTLGTKIPQKELGEMSEKLSKLLGSAGNVYMTSAGINDGYVAVDMTADVPKEKENALKYFLQMVEEMSKLK